MNTLTFNQILQILTERGYSLGEVESALGEWVGNIVETKMEEKKILEIMGMQELIEYLKPYKITRSTIDKWIMKTKRKLCDFPFHKAGRKLHFYRSEIELWLRSKR